MVPIEYKKVQTPCPLSLGGTSLAVVSGDCTTMASSHWGQHIEQPCPPLSRWNKMSFWAERSVSMVEASMSSLHWPSVGESSPTNHCKQPAALSPTVSTQSSCSSSRYKTELCHTFAECGVCKYAPPPQSPPATTAEAECQLRRVLLWTTAPGPSPLHPILRAPSVSPQPQPTSPSCSPQASLLSSNRSRTRAPSSRPPVTPTPPCATHVPTKREECRRQQQSLLGSFALGSRSLSCTSLSDQEGGSGSLASSLSGSENSVFEGAGRRLPIFSQLSVPEDCFGCAGSAGTCCFV
ncbi:hypothetical protein SKAU_G00094350 [Synaphobranchus kaupii]|uniref:Uncharacterized protein n=1 Tax=Synaphobranchus kaupii TaxID=118154 RepID=A0A9Q1J5R0_SYNKA|nr:hypothetical protein SKAU_G00094350 [Synaphobranchus kaupii]